MIVKIHKTKENKIMLAVCDEELSGKKIEEGKKQLDLSSDFYKGEKKSESETGDLMRNADYLNIIGKKSIKLALAEEVIEDDHVMKIHDIPYAQAVVIRE